jgi:hypothetical protein
VRFGLQRDREGDALGVSLVTLETAAEFLLGITAQVNSPTVSVTEQNTGAGTTLLGGDQRPDLVTAIPLWSPR